MNGLGSHQWAIHPGMTGHHHPRGKRAMDHGFREYLFGVSIGGNTAIVQDNDAVGMLRGQVEVMQDRADRTAFLTNESGSQFITLARDSGQVPSVWVGNNCGQG